MKNCFHLLLIITLLLLSDLMYAQVAFPGAVGYGRFAGVNQAPKTAYFVTNLNDNGSGSLRDALSQSNRYVIFNVAGTITLESTIDVTASNIYIAGQTAFRNNGEGITIRSDGINRRQLIIFREDHYVIRYIRVRRGGGDTREFTGDNMTFFGFDWIVDHCSVSWSTDENIDAVGSGNGTFQYSISSEGLYLSTHNVTTNPDHSNHQTGHSKGSLFNTTDGLTIYRNLFAHNDARSPRIVSGSTSEVVNNVMYNNRAFQMEIDDKDGEEGTMRTNIVKNLVIPGCDTNQNRYMVNAPESSTNRIYMQGNIGVHRTNDNEDEWLEVGELNNPHDETGRSTVAFSSPLESNFSAMPDALNLEQIVLADVGANLNPDDVDERIINDVISRTPNDFHLYEDVPGYDPDFWHAGDDYCGIINDQSEVGGWPSLDPMSSVPTDSDNDGMPNTWEQTNNLDPNDPTDALADYGNGYPNIEVYLSELAGGDLTDEEVVNPTRISDCPSEELEAPASWNISADLADGESFVSWSWTLNGQSINLPDVNGAGAGYDVVDAGPGIYVATLNYLDSNGQPQTGECTISVITVDLDVPVCNTILEDDFENGLGNWTPTGIDAYHAVSSNSPNGNGSAVISDDNNEVWSSIFSPLIDLTDVETLSVNFKYRAFNLDGVQSFYLEISTDGGNNYSILERWVHDVDFNNGIIYNETVELVNSYGSALVRFRFTCDAGASIDEVYLDDIEIEACTSSCEDFILQNTNSIITESEQVQIDIESDGIVPAGNTVDFVAGNSILLNGGFEVEETAVFHAYIETCSN